MISLATNAPKHTSRFEKSTILFRYVATLPFYHKSKHNLLLTQQTTLIRGSITSCTPATNCYHCRRNQYSTHGRSSEHNNTFGTGTGSKNFYSNYSSSNHRVLRAQRTLGMREGMTFTFQELRDAYFTCAKQCHPDLIASSGTDEDIANAARAFLRISEAYEYLLHGHGTGFVKDNNNYGYHDQSKSGSSRSIREEENEEELFRQACWHWLGVSPEVVEESKQCPMFRQWLLKGGKSAEAWLNFFSLNGGLAPRLRRSTTKPLQLGEGGSTTAHRRRRRRD